MHFDFEHTPHSTLGLSDVFVMDFIPKDSVVEQLEKESRGRYEGDQVMLTGSSILFHLASYVSFYSLITVTNMAVLLCYVSFLLFLVFVMGRQGRGRKMSCVC